MNQENDRQLSELLKRWQEPAEVPNTFRSSVWTQIAARQEAREHTVWNSAVRMISDFFVKPAFATATAVVVLTFSIGAAHVHAESVVDKRLESAESTYVTSISPLARIGFDGQPTIRADR